MIATLIFSVDGTAYLPWHSLTVPLSIDIRRYTLFSYTVSTYRFRQLLGRVLQAIKKLQGEAKTRKQTSGNVHPQSSHGAC